MQMLVIFHFSLLVDLFFFVQGNNVLVDLLYCFL
jgi:hypothetical protein